MASLSLQTSATVVGCQFPLAPIEARHIQRIAPIDPWPPSRRSQDGYRTPELFDWPWRWGRRRLREQGGEPGLIEQHLLVRCLPQGPDLLFLAPGSKGLLPDGQGEQGFEVVGLGIPTAGFPLPH